MHFNCYNCTEGEINVELVLKPSCCGKYDSSVYVAGVHFTEDDINTFGIKQKNERTCAVEHGVNCASIH